MIINSLENRYQASLLHLLGSCIIAGIALFVVFFFWYPGLLASATGVTKVFLTVVAVDICLGPLLTLIIFNKEKPELKIDLAIIFAIQLAALIYGIVTVAQVRPTFVVFAVDRFEAVHANELDTRALSKAKYKEFQSKSYTGPIWVGSERPEDVEEWNDIVFSSSVGGVDLAQTPKHYTRYQDAKTRIREKSQPLKDLFDKHVDKASVVNALKEKYQSTLNEVTYLPLSCKKRDLSVLLDSNSAEVLEIVDLDPW